MSAEYSVLCGFACACGGVYISGQAARGLLRHQLTAIAGLGGKLIACGKIQQQRCAVQAQIGTGGNGYPEVFADFYADFQCREICSGENQVCADGNILPCISNFFRQKVIRRGKPAFLIKSAIVGDMCFGNDTQKLTLVEGNSAVEHLIIHSDGRTNQEEDIQCFCCFCNLLNCLLGGVQKRCLKEQIRTGIACNGKARGRTARAPALRRLPPPASRFPLYYRHNRQPAALVQRNRPLHNHTYFHLSLEFSEQTDDLAQNGNVLYDNG